MSDGGHSSPLRSVDVAIVGGGAAGLATAIFAARHAAEADLPLRIAILDGAKKLGAKILVSGGGRCNVTNVRVTPDDFHGGSRNTIGSCGGASRSKATPGSSKPGTCVFAIHRTGFLSRCPEEPPWRSQICA